MSDEVKVLLAMFAVLLVAAVGTFVGLRLP